MTIKGKDIERFWKSTSKESKSTFTELSNVNSVTPFIGAGMSVNYRLPSWTALLRDLINNSVPVSEKAV